MRYKRKTGRQNIITNVSSSMAITCVRQPSLVDSFYIEESWHPETGAKIYGCHNPLYMLFNQQRLDRLGPEAINQWIQSLDAAGNSSLAAVRSKISDDDLLLMVRSRHIQHPCELERFMEDLQTRSDRLNSEVARIRAEMAEEQNAVIENNLKTGQDGNV